MTTDDIVTLLLESSTFAEFQAKIIALADMEAKDRDDMDRFVRDELHGPAGQD